MLRRARLECSRSNTGQADDTSRRSTHAQHGYRQVEEVRHQDVVGAECWRPDLQVAITVRHDAEHRVDEAQKGAVAIVEDVPADQRLLEQRRQ